MSTRLRRLLFTITVLASATIAAAQPLSPTARAAQDALTQVIAVDPQVRVAVWRMACSTSCAGMRNRQAGVNSDWS